MLHNLNLQKFCEQTEIIEMSPSNGDGFISISLKRIDQPLVDNKIPCLSSGAWDIDSDAVGAEMCVEVHGRGASLIRLTLSTQMAIIRPSYVP